MAADPIKVRFELDEVHAAIEAVDALTAAAERCAEALSKLGPRTPLAIERTPVDHNPAGSRIGRMDPVGRMAR